MTGRQAESAAARPGARLSRRRIDLIAVAVALALVAGLLIARNLVVPDPLERLAKVEGGWEGSWHFPRGGPYILGYESPGPAQLAIDGAVIARGAGEQTVRRVYQPGVYSVRLEGPPGMRLLWHPPGRRGPLEYVPPSSLSPEQDSAVFGPGAGARRADGLFALAIACILAGLLLFLLRARLRRIDRTTGIAFAAVFGPALLVRLIDLGAAGQTWDEDVNWSAGRNYITNLLALDLSEASWRWNLEHPPVMKYVAGLGAQFTDGYGPSRALSAIMMAFACALMVPIGRRLFPTDGRRVGLVAGIACALTPHLIAHGKIVGHEAPSLLLWTLLIWASLRVHDPAATAEPDAPTARPDPDRATPPADPHRAGNPAADRRLRRALLLVGVLVGLAVSARFVNALAAPLVAAIVLLRAPAAERRRVLGWGLALVPIASLVVFVAIWPRLWTEPIAHLQESWQVLKKPHSAEPYLGVITNNPPADYFLRYLVATAPLGLLLAAALWVPRALQRREPGSLLLLLWFAAPLIVMLSPVRQDGVRYVLPSVAAISMAAGAGLLWLAEKLARLLDRYSRPRPDAPTPATAAEPRATGDRRRPDAPTWVTRAEHWATGGLAAALAVYLAITAARIHPYYLDYYGEHVGGPEAVARNKAFEIAWWGEGLAEALEVLEREAAPGARVHKMCVEPTHLAWMRGDLWATEVRDPDQADWILIYQPAWRNCPVPPGFELAHEVSAAGAPLARLYRRAAAARE